MKNKQNFLIFCLVALLSFTTTTVVAQDDDTADEPTFSFSSVDTYFRASFSEDPVAPGTSFGKS